MGSLGSSSPKSLWLPQVSFPSVKLASVEQKTLQGAEREGEWKRSQIVASGWGGLSLIISKCRQQVKIRKWGDRSRWGRKGEGGVDDTVPSISTGTELLSVAVTPHNDALVHFQAHIFVNGMLSDNQAIWTCSLNEQAHTNTKTIAWGGSEALIPFHLDSISGCAFHIC